LIEATLVKKKLNFASMGLGAPPVPVEPLELPAWPLAAPPDVLPDVLLDAPPVLVMPAAPALVPLPATALVLPLVPVLVPAAVDALPLVAAPLVPIGSSLVEGELHAKTTASAENAAKEILVTI
jgi:hypothetical protein